ncbi:MAG: hypothetical protein NTY10_06365 [Candidatus Omnitrophica bacterium]|nr:hypothetical protein [Candidatus Omnitrophota bacterium]
MSEKEILRPLVEEMLELAALPEQEHKKQMWAEHQALRKTSKIPVCVYYEGIPPEEWVLMLGNNFLQTRSELARLMEFDFRRRIWMARHVNDDHILWPQIAIPAALSRSHDWGVPLRWKSADDATDYLQAKAVEPVFEEQIDISRLHFSDIAINEAETAARAEQASSLTGGRLPVNITYPDLSFSPFDVAVQMRGMQNLLTDAIDAPEEVHRLMDFITAVYEQHHQNREKRGWINYAPAPGTPYAIVGFRVHCAYSSPHPTRSRPQLADEWAYVSAQTSCGFSPEMYREFVHPYNARLAKYFSRQTVYYHGCECLDHKIDIIATLPNLRRFHVSPWSSVAIARAKLGGKIILEVHAHPGKVLFGYNRAEMKKEVAALIAQASGVSLDINLSDIHSVNKNPELLTTWAQAAQEMAVK